MRALPVDYRRCREDACAEGPEEGDATRSNAGEPVVAFTHAIDCRPDAAAETEASGADCSGVRAGNLYLQYWFYYPGSATAEGSTPLRKPIRDASTALGKPTYHPDDWESFQVRIGPDGRRFARASSHHGYGYDAGGPGLIPGYVSRPAPGGGVVIERRPVTVNDWGPDTGVVYVAGGSHAGQGRRAAGQRRARRGRRTGAAGPAARDRRERPDAVRGRAPVAQEGLPRPREPGDGLGRAGARLAPPPVKSQIRNSTSTMISRIPTIVQTVLFPIWALLP